jgi:hypothetical protein
VEEKPFKLSLNTISVQKPAVERGGGGRRNAFLLSWIFVLIDDVYICTSLK